MKMTSKQKQLLTEIAEGKFFVYHFSQLLEDGEAPPAGRYGTEVVVRDLRLEEAGFIDGSIGYSTAAIRPSSSHAWWQVLANLVERGAFVGDPNRRHPLLRASNTLMRLAPEWAECFLVKPWGFPSMTELPDMGCGFTPRMWLWLWHIHVHNIRLVAKQSAIDYLREQTRQILASVPPGEPVPLKAYTSRDVFRYNAHMMVAEDRERSTPGVIATFGSTSWLDLFSPEELDRFVYANTFTFDTGPLLKLGTADWSKAEWQETRLSSHITDALNGKGAMTLELIERVCGNTAHDEFEFDPTDDVPYLWELEQMKRRLGCA